MNTNCNIEKQKNNWLYLKLKIMYPMLPVSLDCPFLITLSVFSNVYIND